MGEIKDSARLSEQELKQFRTEALAAAAPYVAELQRAKKQYDDNYASFAKNPTYHQRLIGHTLGWQSENYQKQLGELQQKEGVKNSPGQKKLKEEFDAELEKTRNAKPGELGAIFPLILSKEDGNQLLEGNIKYNQAEAAVVKAITPVFKKHGLIFDASDREEGASYTKQQYKMIDNNQQLLQTLLRDLESPGTKAPAKEGPLQTPTGAAEKKEKQR